MYVQWALPIPAQVLKSTVYLKGQDKIVLDVYLQLQARTLGCYPPKALSERWPLHWGGCNFIPEDLHPKSFRGYFGHNTNVWAAASRKGLSVGSSCQ